MSAPYYADDSVTLYHGDCREVADWLAADSLVTDPPYGRNWAQRDTGSGDPRWANSQSNARDGIAGDEDTQCRDGALGAWGSVKPAAVFGDLMLAPPEGTRQVLIYAKPPDAGQRGAVGGFRRDVEAIYLINSFSTSLGGRSSIVRTGARNVGNPSGLAARYGHPHAKPIDVLEVLIGATPGLVADPFAGSGSTLVAAKQSGRRAVGVEIEERYCEAAAKRLAQDTLFGPPRWVDLIGIDPDYTDGVLVDEWLELNRGQA